MEAKRDLKHTETLVHFLNSFKTGWMNDQISNDNISNPSNSNNKVNDKQDPQILIDDDLKFGDQTLFKENKSVKRKEMKKRQMTFSMKDESV